MGANQFSRLYEAIEAAVEVLQTSPNLPGLIPIDL